MATRALRKKPSRRKADVPNLARLSIHVADLEKAVTQYSELLGLEGRFVGGGRAYFDCGPVIFALLDPTAGGTRPKPLPDAVYFTVKDVEQFHQRASALGWLDDGEVHGAPAGEIITRPWREKSFYVVDPWGNSLCFIADQTLFTGERAVRG
ncbi:MAG: VOC family protein [Archangium sp.]